MSSIVASNFMTIFFFVFSRSICFEQYSCLSIDAFWHCFPVFWCGGCGSGIGGMYGLCRYKRCKEGRKNI